MRDRNGPSRDVYVFDAQRQTLARISVDVTGADPSTSASFAPSVSGNGRYVAFTLLVPLIAGRGRARCRRPGQHVLHVCVHDVASSDDQARQSCGRRPQAQRLQLPSVHQR